MAATILHQIKEIVRALVPVKTNSQNQNINQVLVRMHRVGRFLGAICLGTIEHGKNLKDQTLILVAAVTETEK